VTAAGALGARFVQLDVTDDVSVARALSEIEARENRLDVLVNNAGISVRLAGVDGMTGAGALAVFDTNVVGVVRVTQAALPLLLRSSTPWSSTSPAGLGSFWAVTNPERHESHYPSAVYGATKAAVSVLTVQYAKVLPKTKFNAVESGFAATDFTAGRRPTTGRTERAVRTERIAA
jgi:NAD(P)-dependent dehydrogenase (short-subunit alcohol dehydrogenase family)